MIENVSTDRALCDLGSSVNLMPLFLCEKLELGEMGPTISSLQLVDYYVKYALGVLEDVPIKVGDLYVSIDFVIPEMEEDTHTLIMLGRPFLATTGCHINVKNGNYLLMWEMNMWSLSCLKLLNSLLFLMSVIGLM